MGLFDIRKKMLRASNERQEKRQLKKLAKNKAAAHRESELQDISKESDRIRDISSAGLTTAEKALLKGKEQRAAVRKAAVKSSLQKAKASLVKMANNAEKNRNSVRKATRRPQRQVKRQTATYGSSMSPIRSSRLRSKPIPLARLRSLKR